MSTQHMSRTHKGKSFDWKTLTKVNVQGTVLSLMVAMIIVVPLVSGTDYLKNYGKPLVFEVLGCLLLAVLASQISFGTEAIRSLQARLKTGPTVSVIAMVLYAAALYFFKPTPHLFELTERAELFRLLFCGLIYIATALYLNGVRRLRVLIDVILGVGAVVAIISLASVGVTGGQITIHGTFGTHETLGSFLLIVLPLALPLALIDIGDQKRQIYAMMVTLLVAAALLIAHTRAAWLGSAVALFVMAVLYRMFQVKKSSAMTSAEKAGMMIGPPLIMAAAIALFLLTSQQAQKIVNRVSTISNLSADRSEQIRHQMAIGALHMIRVKPMFGWGVGTYPLLSYGFTGVGKAQADILKHGLTLDNNAHSFYLQYTAEQGFVGMLIFLSIPILFFSSCLMSLRSMPSSLRKCVTIGCVAAAAGQLVDASISPSYNLPAISMFQFLVFGLGILAARGLDLPSAEPDDPIVNRVRTRRRVSSTDNESSLRRRVGARD